MREYNMNIRHVVRIVSANQLNRRHKKTGQLPGFFVVLVTSLQINAVVTTHPVALGSLAPTSPYLPAVVPVT